MEMNADPYIDSLGIPSLSEKDHKPFIDLITIAVGWAVKHKNAPDRITDPEADLVIYISFLTSKTEWWISRFRGSQRKAGRFYRDPDTYWKAIAIGVVHRKAFEECKKLLPSLDPEKYLMETSTPPAPQKIGPELITAPKKKQPSKRGELWKLDRRWDNLWPSSRKIFDELLSRATYGKRSPRFPWAYGGLKSLDRETGYKERQIRKALHHLQGLSMIKRIFRAYKGQGASKYWVFFTPKMSGAFYRLTIPPKKRRS